MFLVWALAQESLAVDFNAPLFLQLTQSALSATAAYLYLRATNQRPALVPSPRCLLVALTLTLSPVFAFASLRHISYPTMVLAKSCKLIPTMLINVLLYRTAFRPYKYLVVLTVTLGIFVFMYQSPQKPSSHSGSVLGLVYLFINLVLDGLTNSTQDALFASNPSLTGQQMMFTLSVLSSLLSFSLLVLPPLPTLVPSSFAAIIPAPQPSASLSTLSASLAHLSNNPALLPSLLQYGLTSALGQLFIFETLHHFGSLTLITLTLTRKLFTMLLSVLIYGHKLSPQQWAGCAIVFAGIAFEASVKRSEIIAKQNKKKHL
jgi:UDP-galactose transporter B1